MLPPNGLNDEVTNILIQHARACGVDNLTEDTTLAINKINQMIADDRTATQNDERQRWITPIQTRVLQEIEATLSPRITDLVTNTKLGNGTAQKALKRLIEVGLVYRVKNSYLPAKDKEIK